MTKDFLTVATVGYIPQAMTVLRSANSVGRYATCHLFVLDAAPGSLDIIKGIIGCDAEWIKIFGPESLDEDLKNVFFQCFEYFNEFEISCLAKYVGLMHVLSNSQSADFCVFSDCDILFLADTEHAIEDIAGKAMLLTPHQLGPSTDSAEHEYLLHGWINAGFITVNRDNQATMKILQWLVSRISRRGFFAPELGLSCDQTWVSLIPNLFSDHVVVCHRVGYNVAYWNLHERLIEGAGQEILVNGEPLVFFHFSGYLGAPAGQISKHFNYQLTEGSSLAQLCQRYSALMANYSSLRISDVPILVCSKGNLKERLAIGSLRNRLDIEAPATGQGIFSRVGRRLDLLVARFTG